MRSLLVLGLLAAACGRSASPDARPSPGGLDAPCATSPDRGCRVRLFERACEAGQDGAACRQAASFQPETPRGEQLLQAGCDQGDAHSCRDLMVELRSSGRDAARADALFQKAAKVYEKGCDAGRGGDCMALGRMFAIVTPPDEAQAADFQGKGASLLQAACARDDGAACFHLGMAYHDGAGVETDFARHEGLMERACTLGHLEGCAELAASYLASESADDDAKAPALFEKACLGGALHRHPCREAGFIRIDGRLAPPDKARGARFLETSCALADESSCWMLAGMLREGDGVPADAARAKGLLGNEPGPEMKVVAVKRARQAADPAAYQLGVDPAEMAPVKAGAGQDLIVVTFEVRRPPGGAPVPIRSVWVLDAQGGRHASLLRSEFPFGQMDHEQREMVFPVPQGMKPVKVRFELGALTFDLPPA